MTLEGIYEKFNLYRPEDFHGHSLSVSDVVVISRNGKRQAFFVDTIGFKDIPGFEKGAEKLPVTEKKKEDLTKRKQKGQEAGKETALCL